jgi:hypothetical protein
MARFFLGNSHVFIVIPADLHFTRPDGLFILLLSVLVIFAGCVSYPNPDSPVENNLPADIPSGVPLLNQSDHAPPGKDTTASFDDIRITVHDSTVKSLRKRSGDTFSVILLNVSVKNEGLDEVFFFDNRSLVCFQSDSDHLFPEYPQSDYHQVNITNPLLPCTAAPGEEVRGDVYFYWNKGAVPGMPLYVRTPDWTIVGGVYIPDIAEATRTIPDREYPKDLELVVPSAVRKATVPGWRSSPGHGIAIINVSITNRHPFDVTIRSEHLLLLTEKAITLEHGGDKLSPEMARDYIRFPFAVPANETRSGSVFFGVFSGTKVNKIALTDEKYMIQSLIDLNGIYQYE